MTTATTPLIVRSGIWRAHRSVVTARLARLSLTPEAVAGAIERPDADWWAVDTSHADWPIKPPPPVEIALSTVETSHAWAAVHALSYVTTTTPQKFTDAVHALANTPSRREQLAADLADHPIERPFEVWLNGFRNRINHRLGKPQYTLEESRRAHPLAVHLTDSGGGMGDTIVGLYAACGLADLLGRPLVYHAKWSEWIERASHPNLTIKPHRSDIGLDMSGGWDGEWGYNKATRSATSRLWAYCQNCADGFALPSFEPRRPSVDTTIRERNATGRYAVIAPYSSQWPAREWPAAKFTALAAVLVDRGFQVIAVGSPNQLNRMEQTFGPVLGTSWRCGFSPAHVADLMLGAAVIIGNDSGIVHAGGLLGVPTVAIHAGSLPHDYLFHLAPSVRSVTAAGTVGRGDANRASLAGISVEAVLLGVEQALEAASPRSS